MTEQKVKQFEEDVMIDKPITFTLSAIVKPRWWQFWKSKKFISKTFNVKRLRTWQEIRVRTRLAAINLGTVEDIKQDTVTNLFNKLMVNYHKDLIYITGICLSDIMCDEPDKDLLTLIEAATTDKDLLDIWEVMILQKNSVPFINGIISMKGIDLTETNPNQ